MAQNKKADGGADVQATALQPISFPAQAPEGPCLGFRVFRFQGLGFCKPRVLGFREQGLGLRVKIPFKKRRLCSSEVFLPSSRRLLLPCWERSYDSAALNPTVPAV